MICSFKKEKLFISFFKVTDHTDHPLIATDHGPDHTDHPRSVGGPRGVDGCLLQTLRANSIKSNNPCRPLGAKEALAVPSSVLVQERCLLNTWWRRPPAARPTRPDDWPPGRQARHDRYQQRQHIHQVHKYKHDTQPRTPTRPNVPSHIQTTVRT